MELEVYKKSDFYEDYIDSQKEYYERTNADAYFAEQLAEKDKEIADKDAEILRMIEDWNRLCEKYNKFIKLKQEFCDKFKDIELEITK